MTAISKFPSGDCVFKDVLLIPNRTCIVKQHRALEVIKKITTKTNPQITPIKEIVNLLKNAVKNGENKDIINKHIENIKNRLGEYRVYD